MFAEPPEPSGGQVARIEERQRWNAEPLRHKKATSQEAPCTSILFYFVRFVKKIKEVIIINGAFLRKNVNTATLDNLMFEFRCTVDMLKAVHVAMVEGPDRANNYTNALFGVLVAFWNLIDKLSNEIYEVRGNH